MGHRKNFYLSETSLNLISNKANQSAYVDNLIIRDNKTKTGYMKRRDELLAERKNHQVKIADINLELKEVNKNIAEIEEMEHARPEGYDEVVSTLLNLKGGISYGDWRFQADALGVEVDVLKRMLFDDGVYDELLRKK